DCVRREPADYPADLVDRARHPGPLDAAAPEGGVVVDEADHVLSRRLAQLAEQAPSAPPGTDDHDAPLSPAADEGGEAARDRALPEAGGADQERADQCVDDEDPLREIAP